MRLHFFRNMCISVSLLVAFARPAFTQGYHVYYQGTDNNLYGLNCCTNGWTGPVRIGVGDTNTPLAGVAVGNQGDAHVYHILSGHVYDSYCCWSEKDITAQVGSLPPAPGSGLAALDLNGAHVIFYETSDNHIHALSNDTVKGIVWHDQDLSALTNSGAVQGSPLTAILAGTTYALFYVNGADIHTLTYNGTWQDKDLTNLLNNRDFWLHSNLSSFWRSQNSSEHVFYGSTFGVAGGISELTWTSASGWSWQSLPTGGWSGTVDVIDAFYDNAGKNVYYDLPGANIGGSTQPLFRDVFSFSSGTWTNTQLNFGAGPPFFAQFQDVMAMTATAGTSSIPERLIFLAEGYNGCNLFQYTGQIYNITFPNGTQVFPLPRCDQAPPPSHSALTSFLY